MNCAIVGFNSSGLVNRALDRILLPVLQATWEKWSDKRSHWWHWQPFAGKIVNPIWMRADQRATKNVFLGTNFFWEEAVLLEPAKDDSHRYYQIGFRDGSTSKLCSVVVSGRVALLLGPRPVEFFATTRYGTPVSLQQVKIVKRRELDPGIPLL